MTQQFPGILSLFSSIDGAVTLSPLIVLAVAGFFTVVGVIITLLFEYHWKMYAIDKTEILRVRFWYYVGTAVFGGGMLISALVYFLMI